MRSVGLQQLGSTRHSLIPGTLGPGDIEELSPELWEELRLDSAAFEYDLLGRDQAEEEAQGTSQVLDRPRGPSTVRRDVPLEQIPRTSLAGLEGTNPDLHQEFMNELRMLRDQDFNEESNSELLSESVTSWPLRTHLDLRYQEMQHLGLRPCQGPPRERDRHQNHLAVLAVVKMWL